LERTNAVIDVTVSATRVPITVMAALTPRARMVRMFPKLYVYDRRLKLFGTMWYQSRK
jgi:hypothetical protein